MKISRCMLNFGKCRDIINNNSDRKIATGFINECYKIWSCAISLHVLLILIRMLGNYYVDLKT